jgi:hypothetical protein
MYLVPKYISSIRYYNVSFWEHDSTDLFTLQAIYNSNVGELTANDGKYYYRYRDDSSLPEHDRYVFRGWISEKD